MGYKSSYWALLYLEAMEAYSSMQDVGIVDPLVTPNAISAVRHDISKQFIDRETGEVAAWISCDLPSGSSPISLCDATQVLPQQQTKVSYGFMPSLALAVKLHLEPKDLLQQNLATMRKRAQVYGATWQLNSRPLETGPPPNFDSQRSRLPHAASCTRFGIFSFAPAEPLNNSLASILVANRSIRASSGCRWFRCAFF